MGRYDKNGDRKVRFSEFCGSFAPLDSLWNSRVMARNAAPYGGFSEKTKFLYRNLWTKIIKIE
jgi:hypothetical protein